MTARLFDDASNFENRFIRKYVSIHDKARALQSLGHVVVLTSGTFDLIHEGHARYLEAARDFGDFLIVGVDSDDRVRERKGPHRPVVPEMERARMVAHQRGVGIVTLKHPRAEGTGPWSLILAVRPDIVVVTEGAYTRDEIQELRVQSGALVRELPRMAVTSTSARIRDAALGI